MNSAENYSVIGVKLRTYVWPTVPASHTGTQYWHQRGDMTFSNVSSIGNQLWAKKTWNSESDSHWVVPGRASSHTKILCQSFASITHLGSRSHLDNPGPDGNATEHVQTTYTGTWEYKQETVSYYHVEERANHRKQDSSCLNTNIQLARQLCQGLTSRRRHSEHILPHRVQVQLQTCMGIHVSNSQPQWANKTIDNRPWNTVETFISDDWRWSVITPQDGKLWRQP